MLIFYDEDDLFGRIGFDLVLNPHEQPYNNQASGSNADSVGSSFVLKHHTFFTVVGPKSGGSSDEEINNRVALVWYNLGPPEFLSAERACDPPRPTHIVSPS